MVLINSQFDGPPQKNSTANSDLKPPFQEIKPLLDAETHLKANIDNFKCTGFHGSSSAAFYGINRSGSILSPRDLMGATNIVPFGGELNQGILNDGVSLSTDIRRVLKEYSHAPFNTIGWDPERSLQILTDLENEKQIWEGAKSSLGPGIGEHLLNLNSAKQYIERKRRIIWESLSENEREWVKRPFPMVVGVKVGSSPGDNQRMYSEERFHKRSGFEMYKPGAINCLNSETSPYSTVYYVPQDRITEVRMYFSHIRNLVVEPIECLEIMAKSPKTLQSSPP